MSPARNATPFTAGASLSAGRTATQRPHKNSPLTDIDKIEFAESGNRPNASPADALQTACSARCLPAITPAKPGRRALPSILWALPADEATELRTGNVRLLARLIHGQKPADIRAAAELAMTWTQQSREAALDASLALEAVAWAHSLPVLAESLEPGGWWELVETLQALAEKGATLDLKQHAVAFQLVAGELPRTLAYLLPEHTAVGTWTAQADEAISHSLEELLDGEGLPAAAHLAQFELLWASWTRSLLLATGRPNYGLTIDAHEQTRWIVQQALRLAQPDGRLAFSSAEKPSFDHWATSLALHGGEFERDVAASMFPALKSLASTKAAKATGKHKIHADTKAKSKSKPVKAAHPHDLISPAVLSEWPQVSVLRSNWMTSGPSLVYAYGEPHLQAELRLGSEILLSGWCDPQVKVDGQTLTPQGTWLEVCSVSDDDVDYLETEVPLGNGWKLERQVILARKDRFLIWADAILGPTSAHIQYEGTLPLGRKTRFAPASETTEGTLVCGKQRCAVLPLALPEWRSEARQGKLFERDESLILQQQAHAQRLYAPLWIDLDPRRAGQPVTWRQLTVAEKLVIQPNEVAVGYRAQIGNKGNWFVYRSLAKATNRTLLGHNLITQFLTARVAKVGEEVKAIVEIE